MISVLMATVLGLQPSTVAPSPRAPIVVDGSLQDWDAESLPTGKKKVELRTVNDRETLWVAIEVRDRELREQIMRGGLTLWIDPSGSQQRSFGIRYPAGIPRDQTKPGEHSNISSLDTESVVLIDRGRPSRTQRAELEGFQLEARPIDKGLVIEMALPIGRDQDRFSFALWPGKAIAFGLTTGPGHRSGERPRRGGFSGGQRGRGRSRGGAPRPPMEPLDIWIEHTLDTLNPIAGEPDPSSVREP